MKKYRLKEEVKKYVSHSNKDSLWGTLDFWECIGFNLEALEEVPSRIELELSPLMDKISCITKKGGSIIRPDEKDLCEKALNGELYDDDFCIDLLCHYVISDYPEGMLYKDIINDFKQKQHGKL